MPVVGVEKEDLKENYTPGVTEEKRWQVIHCIYSILVLNDYWAFTKMMLTDLQ